ncbi:hypothetical protein [Yeosuana marina]|uniref:hypothetical protein n=1 Tax=Yeosuana marina TaxID=1565536 RepID=UPI0030EDF664|tara:strand:+ start:648 stop:1154 length:507 start_codon:yes stop_codon:yes gene_type:complete
MKKMLLSFALCNLCFVSMNAQEFKVGVAAGLPISSSHQYSASFDASYIVNITDKFNVGLTTGFSHWFKRPAFNSGSLRILETEQVSILPIALTNRFNISKKVTLATDFGYAIPVRSPAYGSGLYFAPKIQYGISKSMDVVLGYRVAKLDYELMTSTIDMLSLGIEFKL